MSTREKNHGEPESTQDARNNNNSINKKLAARQVMAKEIDREQFLAEEATNPEQANLEDSTSELNKRRTEFFPAPQSQNAKEASREDLARQLNVHDLPSEFPRSMEGGSADRELHRTHMQLVNYGFLFGPGKIIGARPVSSTVRGSKTTTMRITYDSKETKKMVIKTARNAHLWGYQEGRSAFFRDVPGPTPKKRKQTKRKIESSGEEKEKLSKRQRTSEPAPRDSSAEQEREEIKTQEFVSKELGREQMDDEIGSFLKQERNRPVEREPTNRRENAETTPEEPNNRALWFDEDEDLTKNNAMYNVASPELVTREYGAESVDETSDAEGRISPLPNDYYSREPVGAIKQEATGDETVQPDEIQPNEGGQEDVERTPPRSVILEEVIRDTPPQDRLGWAEMKQSEILKNQKTKPARERTGYIKEEPSGPRRNHPRAAKNNPKPMQISDSSDSEDEQDEPLGERE